jgi:hypothetical protein
MPPRDEAKGRGHAPRDEAEGLIRPALEILLRSLDKHVGQDISNYLILNYRLRQAYDIYSLEIFWPGAFFLCFECACESVAKFPF